MVGARTLCDVVPNRSLKYFFKEFLRPIQVLAVNRLWHLCQLAELGVLQFQDGRVFDKMRAQMRLILDIFVRIMQTVPQKKVGYDIE
jgi:hypothetical protein